MTSYVPITQESERKQVQKLEVLYIASLCMTPIQFILMGIAIWRGFFSTDNSFFYIALPITFTLLLVQFLTFDKLNKKINKVLEVLNPAMWDRLGDNVKVKYGEHGSISPLEDPSDFGPPDGNLGNKSKEVLWTWSESGETEEFKLEVVKETGEPVMKDLELAIAQKLDKVDADKKDAEPTDKSPSEPVTESTEDPRIANS